MELSPRCGWRFIHKAVVFYYIKKGEPNETESN